MIFGILDPHPPPTRVRRIKATKLVERSETARLFIEGLFQASRCHTPDTAVAISRSPKNYKKNSANKISQHSFRDVVACFDALHHLGWIKFHDGFVDLGDNSYPTVLWAVGELYETFKPQCESMTCVIRSPRSWSTQVAPCTRFSFFWATPRSRLPLGTATCLKTPCLTRPMRPLRL